MDLQDCVKFATENPLCYVATQAVRIALPLILALLLLIVTESLAGARVPASLTRVTTATHAGGESWYPTTSGDGAIIAFISGADLLHEGRPAGFDEVWLYDTLAMTYTRVTSSTDAAREVRAPSLDADGSRVAFHSDMDYFGQGIQRYQYEIWLYDTSTLALSRITTATDASRRSTSPSLSADGRFIAFESDSDFLGQGIPHGQYEIWLYDTATLTYTRLTASTAGRGSYGPHLSADGKRVAFRSDSDFLGQGVARYHYEVWLYDTVAMTVTRVTVASDSNRDSESPSLSGDGTKVAFYSDSDFLGQGIPDGQGEIWLYDTATMTVTRLTVASDSNRGSESPSLSGDGMKVAFYSDSDFLGQGIPDEQFEIWLYDAATMTVTRVTVASDSNRGSVSPSLSADGTKVAFASDSDFLNQGIPDEQFEIWLWNGYHVYLPLVLRQSQ